MGMITTALFFVVLGCSGTEAPTDPEPEAAEAPAPPAKAPSKAIVQRPTGEPAAEPKPLPAAVPMEGYPTVAIVGYGLRLEVNPPFQAALMERGDEATGRLVVSWWDVNTPGAGVHGRAGLHNTSILPGEVVAGAKPSEPTKGEKDRYEITVGGTTIQLPEAASTLGGALAIGKGPADPMWRVQVGDGELQEWPDRAFLHSQDPAEGSAVLFQSRPVRPYGPWVPPPAAGAPKSKGN